MGSGHILVYAFDVLMQIYTSAGWDQREAAQSILKNNLFGLDIDDRAAQLAYFAVMMKARQYDRRLLTRGVQPHVYAIVESNGLDSSSVEYFTNNDPKLKANIERIITEMRDAKEYGSILNITPVDFAGLYARFDEIRKEADMTQMLMQMESLDELLPLVKCAELLAQKYDVVVTNPPYMAVSNAGAKLSDYVKKNFPDSKADMFAVFIERCGQMAKKNGYQAMITQHAWMFLSSFEKLRTKLLAVDIVNMAHLGARAFEEIGGEVVQTTAFVIRKSHIADYKGEYCRLIEPTSQQGKEDMFLAGENRYAADQSNFSKIPGSPVAYWVSSALTQSFIAGTPLGEVAKPRQGMATTNNNRFLRLWHEIPIYNIGFGLNGIDETVGKIKWFPYNKGGDFRKWYGNNDYIVNFQNKGQEVCAYIDATSAVNSKGRVINRDRYFHECMSWSLISSSNIAFRYKPNGFIFDVAGMSCFASHSTLQYLLGLCNSIVVRIILQTLAPTINYQVGDIANIPVIFNPEMEEKVSNLSEHNISAERENWDAFETSWDFKRNPLV